MLRIAPAVCALQGKGKIEETNLSIFELESKCDNLVHDDEKLILNPIIKQQLCPLKHGCIRDQVNQLMELAQEFFSMGTIFAWREIEKLYWVLNCFIFLPEVSDQWFSDMEMFSSSTLSNGSNLYCMWLHSVQTQGKNCLLGKLSFVRASPVLCP